MLFYFTAYCTSLHCYQINDDDDDDDDDDSLRHVVGLSSRIPA